MAAATALPASVFAASCPDTDPQALEWLDRMSRSSHHIAYHGVVTLQRGDDMQVMQISHSINGDSTSEQLTKLTGQGAQIVRDHHPLDCVHTGHRLLQLGAELSAGQCGIAEYYRFEVAPGERVAGRNAVRILVEPRDLYRYGYLMELDSETGLLLKSSTLGRGDLVLERFQFANLSYGSPMPSDAEVDIVHEAGHPLPDSGMSMTDVSDAWAVGWLPRGFVITDGPSLTSGRRTYTDGLAAFSVFVESLSRDITTGEGIARDGSTLSYTRGLNLNGQPVLVTVIGEVPVNTARMVADSVRWTQ